MPVQKRPVPWVLTLFAAISAPAMAATQTQTFQGTLTDILHGGDPGELVFDIARFDPALGTLTGVSMTLTIADFDETVSFWGWPLDTANHGGGVIFHYTPTFSLEANFNDGVLNAPDLVIDLALPTQTVNHNVSGAGQAYVGQSAHFAAPMDVSASVPLDEAFDFTGGTPYEVVLTLDNRDMFSATYSDGTAIPVISQAFTVLNNQVLTSLAVAYTYTAALPEPASVWLLLAGTGLVGMRSRRMRVAR